MPSQLTNEDTVAHRVIPKEDARQGESTGHVRYVLQASLALAVLAGMLLYILSF
jgi:hypothetical protein